MTEKALNAAIAVCGPGVAVRKIGATIHAIADEAGLGVVEKFVGHGVGQEFHSGPTVRHHRNNDPGELVGSWGGVPDTNTGPLLTQLGSISANLSVGVNLGPFLTQVSTTSSAQRTQVL